MSSPTSATFVTATASALMTRFAATETIAATMMITELETNGMQSTTQDSTGGIAVTIHQTPDRSTPHLTGEHKRNKET